MIIFYWLYLLVIALPLLLVSTAIASLFTILGCMLGFSRTMGYYPGRYWSKIFCMLCLVRVDVRGGESIRNNTSYVFVANHQGAFDIFAIYGYLGHNFRWMMKKSLEKVPMVGYACRVAGNIFVDNSSRMGVKQTMEKAESQLAGGMSVVVFPEGSRTRDGRMHGFRRGAFTLAVEFGLPVVPMTIDGAFDVMPRNSKIPRPGRIVLTIHEPIEAPKGGTHDLAALMEESARVIASALPEG